MCSFSLKTLITRLAFAAVLSCACALAQAQLSNFPEFFQKYVHIDATDAEDGPKLRSQFAYTADNTVITRGSVKINNDGFEDQMALGIAQNFGGARAKVVYHSQRYNYSSWDSQTDDVTLDFRYRSLRVQRRYESTAQVSTIGLPVEFSAAHFDLSYSQTQQADTVDPIDVYRFVSRVEGLTFSAAWQDGGDETWADFSTEYRPMRCWRMRYSYSDHGSDFERQFRSEYVARDYRLTGEFRSQRYEGDATHNAGAIGIEKDTKLAVLKLRLEYTDDVASPSVFFNVESKVDF